MKNMNVVDSKTGEVIIPATQTVIPTVAELMDRAGLKFVARPKSRAALLESIRNAGGYVPDNVTDNAVSLLSVVSGAISAQEKAKRDICFAVAIAEETGEFLRMNGPNGKPFKSAVAMFRAAFPQLAESTAGNYVSAGRKVYLPAAKGELPKGLETLSKQEPGNVQIALAMLDKPETTQALVTELSKLSTDSKGRYKQKDLKDAVKRAKEASAPKQDKTKTNGGNGQSDAKAEREKADAHREALRVELKRVLSPDYSNGELYMRVGEESIARFMNTLKQASKDSKAAVLFVQTLTDVLSKETGKK